MTENQLEQCICVDTAAGSRLERVHVLAGMSW
jgi:hypothetical protein